MEIQISREELQKRKLFVAAPMYGGQCAGMFTKSIADLNAMCAVNGIAMACHFLFNESLIPRARNYCVDEFLRSDFTHFLFIDADIGFDPQDVMYMLAMADPEGEYDVLAGPYPKKCISWEKIKQGVDKGFADEDPNKLEELVGDFVFNPIITESGVTEIRLDQPAQVSETGTGFMMIQRKTLEDFVLAYPEYKYLPDHVRTAQFDGSREITMFFQAEIDPKSKRYLSEDYWFCQKVRDIGKKVWLLPWIKLQHVGSYIFGGNLSAMASVGASPTADVKRLGGKPKKK